MAIVPFGRGRRANFQNQTLCKICSARAYVAKNERDNIDDPELEILRKAASSWSAADATMIGLALAEGLLIEVEE